jgi:hypothetical protein
MKRRLALAVCQGWRQESIVNELLAGPIKKRTDSFDHVSYGDTRIQSSSFRNLKRRLVAVGFVFKLDDGGWMITMRFPEEEK